MRFDQTNSNHLELSAFAMIRFYFIYSFTYLKFCFTMIVFCFSFYFYFLNSKQFSSFFFFHWSHATYNQRVYITFDTFFNLMISTFYFSLFLFFVFFSVYTNFHLLYIHLWWKTYNLLNNCFILNFVLFCLYVIFFFSSLFYSASTYINFDFLFIC